MTAVFPIFLALSLLLYSLMHVYVYRRITQVLPVPPAFRWIAIAAGGLLVLSPFVGRALDWSGWLATSRTVNLAAFVWMAWVFWFAVIGLACDAWNGVIAALSHAAPQLRAAQLAPRVRLILTLVLIIAGTAWGAVVAAHPRVVEHRIRVSGWPTGTAPIRVALVSDVHLSTFHDTGWSRAVARHVAAINPDLLVSTGDLTDSPYPDIVRQADDWAAIRPPLGKFAVLGNHDYYSGLTGALAFHRQAGFRLLRGESVEVGENLRLAGLDDPAGLHLGRQCFHSPALLQHLRPAPGRFTVMLRHQPIATVLAPGVIDLQLSGHTHAGQILPFQMIVRLLYPRFRGWYPMEAARLYVSPGTGTWGPPLRVGAPAEITVFVLEPTN